MPHGFPICYLLMIVLFSRKQQEEGLIEFLKFWKYIIAGSGQLVNKQKSAMFFSVTP
jgi:hypothetical protein